MTKPFIKWAGGKSALIDVILPQLLATGRKTLVSPFLGGGAIELAWLEAVPDGTLIASDANWQLVATWKAVRDNVEAIIDLLEWLSGYERVNGSDTAYYDTRVVYNSLKPDVEDPIVAAHFIYLNKTAFNGLYRVNAKGGFNAPWGKRSFSTDYDSLRAVSKLLNERDVALNCCDYYETLRRADDGAVVYADPPYKGVFSSYTKDGFTDADHVNLARSLSFFHDIEGAYVFASNSAAARDIYESRGFAVQSILARRRISCDGNRDDAAEILAVL